MKLLFHTFFAMLIFWDLTLAAKVLRPKFNEMVVWNDDKFCTHNITLDDSDPHMNFSLNVLQQLHVVDLHIEARITHKLNSDHFFNFNTSFNLCNILDYKSKSPIGALVGAYLKGYGHILEKCPIVKGRYYLNRFWIPEDTTLSSQPEIDFQIDFKAYHVDASKQQTMIINDHVSGELVVYDVTNVKQGLLRLLPKVRRG